MPHRVLFAFLLLAAAGAATAFVATADDQADLKAKVQKLVQQLGDADADKQAAASTALIKLGPDILPLLPGEDAKLSADQMKNLKAVRNTLLEARAQRDLTPRPCTLKGKEMSLKEALKELAKQTGNEVMDGRQSKDDLKFKLDLHKVTFWQALDTMAKEADLRVAFHNRDNKVALMDGPHKVMPVNYHGIFRITVKRVLAVEDLEAEAHLCQVFLEITWEPRFQPLFLEAREDALEAKDDKGGSLKVAGLGSGKIAVSSKMAIEVPIRMEAPPRAAAKLGQFKGELTAIGPSKMLDFTFDKLAAIDRAKADQARKEIKEGVTVSLRGLSIESELWTATVALEYPAEGPEFESFESWLVNNQIFLVNKDGKQRIPANGGYEIDDQAGHKAIINYHFVEQDGVVLDKPSDWKLIYRTAGGMTKLPIQFDFKELPLP